MIYGLALIPAALALAACSTTPVTQSAYALAAALDTAEKAAFIYEQSPAATPAAVARLKSLDAAAYASIAPLAANANNATADEVTAAQSALAAFVAAIASSKGD